MAKKGVRRKYTIEQSKSFLHSRWSNIKQRCYNPNSPKYSLYGGRGIKMCDEWRNNYVSFYNWAIQHGAKRTLSIDRIDNNGNYEPSNCRWVDAKTQIRNRSITSWMSVNGVVKTRAEWCEIYGLPYDFVKQRLQKGYTPEQALGLEKKERTVQDRTMFRKSIIQYDNDGNFIKEWLSAQDVHDNLGISLDSIYACCGKKLHNFGGYTWRYKGEKPPTPYKRKSLREPVIQYDLEGNVIKQWDSLYDIKKELGFNISSIRNCITGRSLSFHGFVWKREHPSNKEHYKRMRKAVMQFDLEWNFIAEYPSVLDAALSLGVSPDGITRFCAGNKRNKKHCAGFLWKYKENNDE